jgi:AcrR family transcriptional regulator
MAPEIAVPRRAPDGLTAPLAEPRQARAREMQERLLAAAQAILERGGLEAVNSNAVAAEAGATPPSFYRYFRNKHDLLAELGRRLMSAQNLVIEQRVDASGYSRPFDTQTLERVLMETFTVTRRFQGGREIISSLRAVPELLPIRLESHAHMARLIAAQSGATGRAKADAYARARLAVELGYAAIEMLLEVPELDARRVLRSTALAVEACLA